MAKKIDSRMIPEVNIGTVGHVDHGKSTLVEAITGKWPASHSEELKRGITIKLGYADATIYKCEKGHLATSNKCLTHACKCEPVRTISFVDAPGHETLMATVIAGSSLMDGALLIIAANEKCPQPQTREHLMTLDISGIKNIVIVQTKIDVVGKEAALEHYKQIKEFVKGTVAENAPIIPVSSQKKVNIDSLLEVIEETIKTPKRESTMSPKMYVIRSFDVNKPGTLPKDLGGGILGGALLKGHLRVGDEIEICPGVRDGEKYRKLKTKITGLHKIGTKLDEAGPGGLLGVRTSLDPSLTKTDNLSGNVVGLSGKVPRVLESLNLTINLFEKLTGSGENIQPIKTGESLLLNVGTGKTLGVVKSMKKGIDLDLKIPICADKGERVVISRRIEDRWRLVGWADLE